MIRIKYTFQAFQKDHFWLPIAITGLFMIIVIFIPEINKYNSARSFLGFILPLITGGLSSYALLQDNMRLNAVNNVQTFPYALNSKGEKLQLSLDTVAVMHSTEVQSNAANVVEVEGLSLDDFFEEQNITQCDFMKIDCEGFVLRSGPCCWPVRSRLPDCCYCQLTP